MTILEKYQFWLNDEYFDDKTKAELKLIEGNEAEIEDRFYRDLDFGTGGLRGIIGAGTNRVNIYTIRKATQGLANYILEQKGEEKGVAIAYDSRHMSREFAMETALCLCANGIKTYLFDSLRPTPELSFALRKLDCIAGVVITASHNPAEYNGYKVYWEDGAQITAPKDREIIDRVNQVTDYSMVKTMEEISARNMGLLKMIGNEIDDAYIDALKRLVLNPDIIVEQAKNLKIVYTPLHGTGNILVKRILAELGFENVYVVSRQEQPDGAFPTVKSPNPEDKDAFVLALELARQVDADIVLATDPDADRLGVYVKDGKNGEYQAFTGNMSGMIILDYILSQRKEKHTLPANGAVITTVVSSNMAKEITDLYDVRLIETLTGFKYIGEQIKFFEQDHTHDFLFGYEESYGCLIGTHARDKDAVVAVMSLCEAAAYYKGKNLTLIDQMENLYRRHGYFLEDLKTVTLKGIAGATKIKKIMDDLRNNPPKSIDGYQVVNIVDYLKDTGLPKSDVVYLELAHDAWCCIRPSGTEPKIKFYIGVKEKSKKSAKQSLEKINQAIEQLVSI